MEASRELREYQYKIIGGSEPFLIEDWEFHALYPREDFGGHWWIFRRLSQPHMNPETEAYKSDTLGTKLVGLRERA